MGQSSPSSQTVTNKTEIDPVTQQWRSALFDAGMNLFNQGPAQYYPGQTIAPYSQQTLTGLNMLQNQAQQGAVGLPQAYNALNRSMSGYMPGMDTAMQASNGGMMNPFYGQIGMYGNQNIAGQVAPMFGAGMQQNPYASLSAQAGSQQALPGAMSFLNNGMGANPYANQIASAGQSSVAQQLNPYINQIMSSANAQSPYGNQIAALGQQQTTAGMDTLNRAGQGDFSHLDGLYNRGAEQITKDLNARFAGAGRTGPNAAYAQQLGNSLGNLYTDVYAPGVEAERNRQFNAAGQLAGIQQQDRATAMSGLQTAAGMQSNTGALLQAAGLYSDALGNDFNRNIGALNSAAGLTESGYGRSLQGAGLYGDLANTDYARQLQGYGQAGNLAESGYGRMMQGAGMYGDLLNTDANRRYQSATDQAGLWGQDMGTRLQGAQLAGNMWSQGNADALGAAAMLPSMYQYGSMPAETMMQVGGAQEQMNQAQIDEDRARWDYSQNAGWQNAQRFAGLMSGMPDFSSQTTTTTGPGRNRGMSLLGGASTGFGMANSLGLLGGAAGLTNPLGWAMLGGGALLGGLG